MLLRLVASRESVREARSSGYFSRVVDLHSLRLLPGHCTEPSGGGEIAGDVRFPSDCFHNGGAGMPTHFSQRLVLGPVNLSS